MPLLPQPAEDRGLLLGRDEPGLRIGGHIAHQLQGAQDLLQALLLRLAAGVDDDLGILRRLVWVVDAPVKFLINPVLVLA